MILFLFFFGEDNRLICSRFFGWDEAKRCLLAFSLLFQGTSFLYNIVQRRAKKKKKKKKRRRRNLLTQHEELHGQSRGRQGHQCENRSGLHHGQRGVLCHGIRGGIHRGHRRPSSHQTHHRSDEAHARGGPRAHRGCQGQHGASSWWRGQRRPQRAGTHGGTRCPWGSGRSSATSRRNSP